MELLVGFHIPFITKAFVSPPPSNDSILGGVWGSDFKKFASENDLVMDTAKVLAMDIFATQKNMWRVGRLRCPKHCALHKDLSECKCTCPYLSPNTTEEEAYDIMTKSSGTIALDPDRYLLNRQGKVIALELMRFMCNDYNYTAPSMGESLESSSPADPTFWPIHPTLDRLFHRRMIAGFAMSNWTDNTSKTSVGNTGICTGHNYLDGLPSCTNLVEDDEDTVYTNKDLFSLFDPTKETIPYLYADFTWTHCAALGYGSDLLDPNASVPTDVANSDSEKRGPPFALGKKKPSDPSLS